MARGTRGPANTPEQSVQQQLDALSQRVRELETKRVLAAPVSSLDKTRDPVDGEQFVDHRDGSAMWQYNGMWRYGVPGAAITILPQTINYEPDVFDRDWQSLVLEQGPEYNFFSSEGFYLDEDEPTKLFVKTPGTYLTFLYFQMSDIEGYHGYVDLSIEGDGLDPGGLLHTGANRWHGTTGSVMASGDPTLNPMIHPAQTAALVAMDVQSFPMDTTGAVFDYYYEQDNPDDDEEVPFPEYTRWIEARVFNYGPDTFDCNASGMTVFRLGNTKLA